MNIQGVAQAIYARLAGYTALTSQITSIGYERPQDVAPEAVANFPYCVIDDITQQPWDTKTSDGGNQLVQVTVYARPNATKSGVTLANEAAQAIYDALHKYDLTVSGSNVVNCLFDGSPGNLADPDGVTRYKPMTFRIMYDDET